MCGRAFRHFGSLKRHLRVHTGDRPYVCSLCNKGFIDLSHLQTHNHCVHSNKRLYQCCHCGKMFKTNRSLQSHVRVHAGEKPNSCRHCSDRFTWLDQLKRHLLESHNEGTWLSCDICRKKFSLSRDLSYTYSDMKD